MQLSLRRVWFFCAVNTFWIFNARILNYTNFFYVFSSLFCYFFGCWDIQYHKYSRCFAVSALLTAFFHCTDTMLSYHGKSILKALLAKKEPRHGVRLQILFAFLTPPMRENNFGWHDVSAVDDRLKNTAALNNS